MVSCVLLCFSLLAFSSQQFLANSETDLITKTCDQTSYKDVCKSLFSAVPESKSADLDGLAKIAMNLAAKQAKYIHDQIQVLSNPKKKAIYLRLNDCSENYQDAIEQLQDAEKALKAKSYSDIDTWISAVMSDAQACEKGFKKMSENASPLTDLNNKFYSICSIVSTICNLLDGKA